MTVSLRPDATVLLSGIAHSSSILVPSPSAQSIAIKGLIALITLKSVQHLKINEYDFLRFYYPQNWN
jgi:hypothetical protein